RVAHGDAVVDRDGVELACHAARLADRLRHDLAEILEVYVAGDELGVRVGDRDDRLAEVAVGHPGRSPQGTRPGGVTAVGGGSGTQSRHGVRLRPCSNAWTGGGPTCGDRHGDVPGMWDTGPS